MTSTKTVIQTKILPQTNLVWKVILFDCNCHTIESIMIELSLVLGCSTSTAFDLALLAERLGSVIIFAGDKEKCIAIAQKLEKTWITVEVQQ